MTEIVFIVEEFDKNGNIVTLADKFYKNFPTIDYDKYFNWTKNAYYNNTGIKIKYQTYSSLENFDPNIKYFYFIPIALWSNDFHNWFLILDKEKQQRLADNKVNYLFAYDHEHLPSFDINFFIKSFEWFMTMYWVNGIVGSRFYFLSASDISIDLKNYLDGYFGGLFKFIYSPLILSSTINSLSPKIDPKNAVVLNNNMADDFFNNYIHSSKTKQFLSLNRFARYHRDLLIYGLRANNLLDEGFVSRNLVEMKHFELPAQFNSDYANLVRNNMKIPLSVMNLDSNSEEDSFSLGYVKFPFDLMAKSCYDIVNETATTYEIYQAIELTMLTEKTAKALAFGRPFMINGGPNSLSLLNHLGFETCNWIFDESYDQPGNLIDRQEIIIKNIMNHMTNINGLWDRIKAHKDILLRNQNKFFNFSFENYIVKELTNE